MKPLALVGAAVGGLVGALIWAAIAYYFEYEVGYMALGVGALVGLGAVAGGGSGQAIAGCCSAIAVVSILGGKVLAVSMMMDSSIAPQFYAALQPASVAYAEVRTDWDVRQFMVDGGFTEAASAGEVSRQEVQSFRDSYGSVLEDMAKNHPDLDQWRKSEAAREFLAGVHRQLEDQGVTSFNVVKSSIGIIDVIFFVLGIMTAYRVALHHGMVNAVETSDSLKP